ncbi:MAG TPA: hypothetical protein VF070_24715 [Streptosporangiaceae bacterium]
MFGHKEPKESKGPEQDTWIVTGAPRLGTEAAVEALDRGDGNSSSLTAVDPSFDQAAFVAWSKTVYDRATAAWKAYDPELLRAVMDPTVWVAYAKHLLMAGATTLVRNLMSASRATAGLVGTTAGGGQQSALIMFHVAPDPTVFATWKYPLPLERNNWEERWLFQREASCRTHDSGAVAVCPVCGAPADPEETGHCRYCHADITTRTAGWLVTRTATTATKLASMDERVVSVRERIQAKIDLPPAPVVAAPLQPPRAAPPG